MDWIEILTALPAYLLGSIPSAVWVGKTRYGIDVREHGSKNAGATNTFRVLGKKAGRVVLGLDVLKGILACLLPYFILSYDFSAPELTYIQLVAAFLAVLGHVFPIFAQFNGGKGVATSLGVICGLQPAAALICLVIFLLVFILSSYVSLGSIIASISFALCIWIFWITENTKTLALPIAGTLLAAVVVFAHRKNITRLLNGTESKMNLFKKNA